MTLAEPFLSIVQSLESVTEKRKADWSPVTDDFRLSPDKERFRLNLDAYTVQIRQYRDPEGDLIVELAILDSDSDVIESYEGFSWVPDSDFERLTQLWDSARRIALDVDEALNSIAEQLKRLESTG